MAALLGLIGGPLSYQAGDSIGSITLSHNYSYIVLAISWAIAIPLLLYLIKYLTFND